MPRVSAEHLDRRREQILEAAVTCAARKGFHQTTMRDICGEAGLSIGAVYNYFQSKEEILEALTQRGRVEKDRLMQQLEACPTARQALTALLRQMFAAYAHESFRTFGPVDVETYGEALRNPRVRGIAQEEIRALAAPVTSMIRRWQADGQLRETLDADALAYYLVSVSVGVKLLLLLLPDLEVDRLAALVEEAFLEGALTEPTRGGPPGGKEQGRD